MYRMSIIMNQTISLILIITAIGVISAFIIYSMSRHSAHADAAKILQYGREREYFIYEMLRSVFPHHTVMRNLFFPVPTKEGIFDTETDIVCVTRGGIAVIEVKGSKGDIECPPEGMWCQHYKQKLMHFESPYKQNQGHIKALRRVLDKHGISGVPIKNYVVFPDLNVRFSHSYPWLMRSDKIIDALEELDNRLVLSRRDQNNISSVLQKYKKRRHPAFFIKKRHSKKRTSNNENKTKKIK